MAQMDPYDDAKFGMLSIIAGCVLVVLRVASGVWHYRGGVAVEAWQSTAGAVLCFIIGTFFVVRAIIRKLRK